MFSSKLETASELKGRKATNLQILKAHNAWILFQQSPEISKHQIKRAEKEKRRISNLLKGKLQTYDKLIDDTSQFQTVVPGKIRENSDLRLNLKECLIGVKLSPISSPKLDHQIASVIIGPSGFLPADFSNNQ